MPKILHNAHATKFGAQEQSWTDCYFTQSSLNFWTASRLKEGLPTTQFNYSINSEQYHKLWPPMPGNQADRGNQILISWKHQQVRLLLDLILQSNCYHKLSPPTSAFKQQHQGRMKVRKEEHLTRWRTSVKSDDSTEKSAFPVLEKDSSISIAMRSTN